MKQFIMSAAAALLAAATGAQAQQGDGTHVAISTVIFKPAKVAPTPERIAALKAPPGFSVSAFATGLKNIRVVTVAPDGTVYVSRRDQGDVLMLKDVDGDGRADGPAVVVAATMAIVSRVFIFFPLKRKPLLLTSSAEEKKSSQTVIWRHETAMRLGFLRVPVGGRLRQYRRQQAGKALVDIGAAQRVHMGGAGAFGAHQPRFAQHLEVMRYGRLRPATVELTATGGLHFGQLPHDAQAYRVAQRVEHAFEDKIADDRVFIGTHGQHDTPWVILVPLFVYFRTIGTALFVTLFATLFSHL
jgi:hypothetical protein